MIVFLLPLSIIPIFERLEKIMAEQDDVKDVLERVKGLTTPKEEAPKTVGAGAEKRAKLAEERKQKREELLVKINEFKEEYAGLEGDVPLHSEYWVLLNEYRALQ
jgi:hypothetical protein